MGRLHAFLARPVAGFFALSIALALAVGCGAPGTSDAERPNVVLIVSDDHSWPYFGFMGSKVVETPNLDRLAAEGVVFTHGFSTASVCRPALNSLLTGLHPAQWEARNEQLERQGVERVPMIGEIDHFETLPKLLGAAGYRSFQGGKYWEGSYAQGGFDVGVKSQEKGYANNPVQALAGGDGLALGRESLQPLWDFIDADSEQPFFVWYAPMLPHRPHDPPHRHLLPYQGKKLHREAELYYAMITWLDEGVGQILEHLEQRDLTRDTLVIFLTDNGYEQPPRTPGGFTGGVRGKLSIREMGFRTPIIASWPGRIRGDRRSDALVSLVDVFPTIADYAGVEVPPDREGRSLRPYLDADEEVGRERIVVGNFDIARLPNYVVERSGGAESFEGSGHQKAGPKQSAYALRTERWRYVWFMDAGVEELYEIQLDPMETRNVVAQHQELAAQFRGEVEAWLAAMRAPYAD